jgi:chemotaxis response regulator CheB
LAKIGQFHPDLITLDVEMPVMNGLQALAEVRKLYPKLPVILQKTHAALRWTSYFGQSPPLMGRVCWGS